MSRNSRKLLNYLSEKRDWVTSSDLSLIFGVSKRQIANYVAELNANAIVIQSSPRGYKISPSYSAAASEDRDDLSPRERQRIITKNLCFSADGLNVYDAADELFVSDFSIESDLNILKGKFQQFYLKPVKRKDTYSLTGSENNIRRFIVIELYHNDLEEFFHDFGDDFKPEEIRRLLKKTVQRNGIFINDYSLALFTLNLCVGIKRAELGYAIDSRNTRNYLPLQYTKTVEEITDRINTEYKILLNDGEKSWVLDTLTSSSTLWDPKSINITNLSQYVEEKYIDITRDLIEKVKVKFPNTKFEEDFLVRFTIHIRNCFLQQDYETYNIDSLTKRIKYDYPIIFEIAVFIADYLENNYGLSMTQNELTYIAFHICSSLTDFTDFQVTITFVYADYWDYHKKVLDQLIGCIGDKGIIKQSVSVSDYVPALYHSDVIITDSGVNLPEPCIKISSIPTKENTLAVANFIDKFYLQKQYDFFINNFRSFFNQNLFIHYNGSDYIDLLQQMCSVAEELGLINDDFFPDILKRERLDNTAFNLVAIPHTLTVDSNSTFLSVAIINGSLKWGDSESNIKLVVMLGINKAQRKTFSTMYDFLVNLLSNESFVIELSKTNSFNEFINKIAELAGNYDNF